tara:strand:- start:1592 stop:2098 length:507 start_codon:yes stop_codon:yes gene_type:complete
MNIEPTTILLLNLLLIGILIGLLAVVLFRKKPNPTFKIINEVRERPEEEINDDDDANDDEHNVFMEQNTGAVSTCEKASKILDDIEAKNMESSEESSEYSHVILDERDDVYGSCSEASQYCQLYASCTSNDTIKSGCQVVLENDGVQTRYACPSDCCKRNILEEELEN